METLQNKAFGKLKRTVLENQRDPVRNRADVATFFGRSGASPVVVSAVLNTYRNSDATRLEIYRTRF